MRTKIFHRSDLTVRAFEERHGLVADRSAQRLVAQCLQLRHGAGHVPGVFDEHVSDLVSNELHPRHTGVLGVVHDLSQVVTCKP